MEHLIIKGKSSNRGDLVAMVKAIIDKDVSSTQHVQIDDNKDGSTCLVVLACDTGACADTIIKSLFGTHDAVIADIERRTPNADNKTDDKTKGFKNRGY